MGQVHHHRPLKKSERVFSVIRTTTKKMELKLEELVTHAKLCLAFPYVIFLVVLAISTRFI